MKQSIEELYQIAKTKSSEIGMYNGSIFWVRELNGNTDIQSLTLRFLDIFDEVNLEKLKKVTQEQGFKMYIFGEEGFKWCRENKTIFDDFAERFKNGMYGKVVTSEPVQENIFKRIISFIKSIFK